MTKLTFMKKSFILNLILGIMLFGVIACDKNTETPNEPPTPPVDEPIAENGDPIVLEDFTVTLQSLHSGDVLIDIKPENKDITYWYSLQIKEEMPTTDEEILEADMAYFEYLCRYYAISLEELLSQNLINGDHKWRYQGLQARTEYVFYLYGLQSDGTAITSVNQMSFITTAVEPIECSFEIIPGDEITATSFSFTILPSDENVGYFYDVLPTAWYEEYCQSSPDNIPAFIESYIPALASEYGYSIEEVVGMISAFGPITDDFSSEDGIEASSTYYVFAVGVGANGTAVTNAEVLEITTANPPVNTYDVVEGTVEDDRATFYVTPDHYEPFVALFELQEYMYDANGNPLSDEEIIEAILAAQGDYIYNHVYSGSSSIFDCPLIPEKDYWCLVFGYNNGQVTTPLTKVGFTTKAADANDSDIIVSVSNVKTTSADASFQPYNEPMPHMFNYMPYSKYVEYGANDEAIKRYNNELVEEMWDPSVMSKEEWLSRALETGYNSWAITGLEPETKYVLYAIGMVPDGSYTTEAFIGEFTTKEVKEGPQVREILFTDNPDGDNRLIAGWFYFENGTDVSLFKMSHISEDPSIYNMSDEELLTFLEDKESTSENIYVAEISNQTYITVHTYQVPSGAVVYYAGAVYDSDGNHTIVRTTYTAK